MVAQQHLHRPTIRIPARLLQRHVRQFHQHVAEAADTGQVPHLLIVQILETEGRRPLPRAVVQDHADNRAEEARPRVPGSLLVPNAALVAEQPQAQPVVHRGLVLDQYIHIHRPARFMSELKQHIRLGPSQFIVDKRSRLQLQRGEVEMAGHVPRQPRLQPGAGGGRIAKNPAHQGIVSHAEDWCFRHAARS